MKTWTKDDYQHMMFAQFLQLDGQIPEQVDTFFYLVGLGFRPYEAQKLDIRSREYQLAKSGMLYVRLMRAQK